MRGHQAGTQPLCRCCGTPIRKLTGAIVFGRTTEGSSHSEFLRGSTARPKSRAEAQAYVNETIVSSKWAPDRAYILEAAFWDGISYVAEHFCTNRCAIAFGELCAREGRVTQAYNDAIRARREAQA